MYNAQFQSKDGTTFSFGLEWGTAFDVDPLSGVDVKVSTSQGFQQIGNTITGSSVEGVKRQITGIITDKSNDKQIARRMQKVFSAFTNGRLIVGDRYCDAVVQKTPEFLRVKQGWLTFSLQIFCPSPYWMSTASTIKRLGGYIPSFRFPVNYSVPHRFGVKTASAFFNCYSAGEANVPYKAQFTALGTVRNFGLIDIYTMDFIKIYDEIIPGDIVTVGREDGRLYVRKRTADGIEQDIFAKMDESSTLYYLRAGDNVLKATAEDGEEMLVLYMEYTDAFLGVID